MITKKNVTRFWDILYYEMKFFGSTREFYNRAIELLRTVGKTLAHEQGYKDPEDAIGKIPEDTELGEKATLAFYELKQLAAQKE